MTDLQMGFYVGLLTGIIFGLLIAAIIIVSRNIYEAYKKRKEEEHFQWLRHNPPHWDGKGGCWR